MNTGPEIERLSRENAELRARLEVAEETLHAIQRGDIDALVVGKNIYTLDSANATANQLRKDVLTQMQDAVLALDNADMVIFMNPAAEQQYGLRASAVLGFPRTHLYEERWPDPSLEQQARESLHNRGSYRSHTVHQTQAGKTIHVEATVSRLYDGALHAIGYLMVIRDITERIQAELALNNATLALMKRERQFATIVETSPDIFSRFDRSLRHIYVSPSVSNVTGLPVEAFIGKTNTELGMPPDLCILVETALDKVFETGRFDHLDFVFTTPAQQGVHFACRLMPEFSDDGSVETVLAIASDVTEQKRVEQKLLDSDRRKDEFLATLAHELRNPLAPIHNALQIMQLSQDPVAHEKACSIIARQLKQMVHLVDDLLDVNRISQGKVELRREHVDLIHILNAAVETSRPLIDAGGHSLAVRLPPLATLMVDADVTRLTQALANLLNNAAKYTQRGGRIEISAEVHEGMARISVQDSGIGIPPAMLDQVFDMFTQVDRTLDRGQGGLGIGLALVKNLIEMHGGSVQAFSAGEDQGSQFVVNLPLSNTAADSPRSANETTLLSERPAGFQVLIVDDNIDNAESLSEVLQVLGYRTLIANDGAEAIEMAKCYLPRAAVLDIGLPKMNGHDVARKIREQPWGRDMLLIALSGWGQYIDHEKSIKAGFDYHCVKPLEIERLVGMLARLPEEHQRSDALEPGELE